MITLPNPEPQILQALHSIAEPVRRYGRNSVIQSAGELPHSVYLLLEGWVLSEVARSDGIQSIAKIHLPGDLLGTPNMCLTTTMDRLVSVTPVAFRRVSIEQFARLFRSSPTFAASMFVAAQYERVILSDRTLVNITSTADQKLAAFLLHIYERLESVDLVDGRNFHLPLTQEQVGRYVGLSIVQVSRSLKGLEELGLILRAAREIQIVNLDELMIFCACQKRQRSHMIGTLLAPKEIQ